MKYSKNGYKRNSEDVNNPYNIIPSGNITMKGVDFPVMGTDDYGNQKLMMPGGEYIFPGNNVFEVPLAQMGHEVKKRKGKRENEDGSHSTHLMKTETIDGINWFSFPSLFQNDDGEWIDMSEDEDWKLAAMEAEKRGELYHFGTNKAEAIKFGEGSWKAKNKSILEMQRGGSLPKAQDGVDYSITKQGYRPIDDQFFDSFQDRHYKCGESDGCVLRPTRSLGYNTGDNSLFASYNPEIEVPLFGADRIRGGGTVFAGGLEGRGNLNYDFNTNKPSLLTELTATGRLGFNKYGRRREGQGLVNPFTNKRMDEFDPKTEFGIQAGYDVLNNKMKDVGLYGRYGILDANLGYNLNNKQVQAGIGLRFQDGGSLRKFQGDVGGSETKNKATVFIGDDRDGMFEEDFNRMKGDLDKKYGVDNYQVIRAADIQNEMSNTLNSGKTPVDFSIDEYNRLKKLRDGRGDLLINQAYETYKNNFPNHHLSQYNTLNEMYEDQSGTAEDQMRRMNHYEEYTMRPSYDAAFENDEEYIQTRDNFSDYSQNKGAYDKQQNAFKSLSSEDKLKYYKTYFENMGEGSDVYMLKHGDNMFLSKAGTLSEGTRSDFDYGSTPGKIDTFAEAMTAWGPATTGTCYMGVCDGLPGAAHIANETGMTTKAQQGNWAGYYDRSGTYGEDQTFDEQFFNPHNTDPNKSGGIYNTYTKEGDRVKIVPEHYEKLNPYFLGPDSSKWDDHWNKALGGSLPKAQFGRNSIMSGNAYGLRPEGSTGVMGDVYDKTGVTDGKWDWLLGTTETGGAQGAAISNILDVLSVPGNLITEGVEYFGERGDKEFNFSDAMPGFSGDFSFTNMHGEPTKTVSGTTGEDGKPLVENFWGALATDILTDPSTWVGAGAAKNTVKSTPNIITQLGKKTDEIVEAVNKKIKPKTVYNAAPTNTGVEAMESGVYGKNINTKTQEILDNNVWATQNPLESTKYLAGDHATNSIRKGLLTGEPMTLTEYQVRFPWLTGDVSTNKNILDLKKSQGVIPNTNEFLIPKNRNLINRFLYPEVKSTDLQPIPKHLMSDPMFNPNHYNLSYGSSNNFSKPYTYIGDQIRGATGHADMPYGFNNAVNYTDHGAYMIDDGIDYNNLVNKWQDEKGFNMYKRKHGGSLPQFQKKGENSYQVEVIQYPLGYDGGQGGMLPGHIESRYLGDLSGTDYEGQKGYVNRWVNSGNRPVTYNAEEDYENGVRTSILNLNEEEFAHYMKTAQTFTPGDKTDLPKFMGKDYRGKPFYLPTAWGGDDTDYDLVNSNCADGVCSALGLDGDYTLAGITTPQKVMDAIKEDKRTESSTGNKRIREVVLDSFTPILNQFDLNQTPTEALNNTVDFIGGTATQGFKDVGNSINSFFGGSSNYWKEGGERWENTNQIEEYQAYFKNPKLIDKSWGKDSTTALKIKEAVDNNIFYNELPDYLKGVDTWKSTSSSMDVDKELKILEKAQDGTETNVSFDDLEKGIRHVESLNGTLMKNKQSSASGYYGDLFDNLDYDGTRAEFIADTTYQKNHFIKRYNGEVTDVPGLESNGQDIYNEYKDQVDFTYTPTQIAALSNMLGRQGTRKYFGDVLRDEKTLEEVFPHLYGDERQLGKDGKPLENKTPDEYINKFTDAISKKRGGEFTNKIKRLKEQLAKYNKGGLISPLAEQELVKLKMIKPKMQNGAEVKKPYVIKRGDNLSTIARDNNMSLSEILSLNPRYKNDPSKIGVNQVLQLSDAPVENSDTPDLYYTVKKGDSLSKIASKYGVRYQDIQSINGINNPSLIKPGKKLRLPDNVDRSRKHVQEQIKRAESVYTPSISEVNVDQNVNINVPWAKRVKIDGEWVTQGKRNTKTEINKMEQADRIVEGMKEIHPKSFETSTYKVKSGDNLSTIAANNNMTITELEKANNIDRNNDIQVGQDIKISKPTGKPYIVVDEKLGRMHLYYPGQDKPAKSYPILTGANEGDAQTVTKIGIFKDGEKLDQDALNKAMKDNLPEGTDWTVDNLLEFGEGYTSEADWDAGNKQTGAGVYTIGMINEDSGYYDDSGNNNPTPSFVLNNSNGAEVPMVIHTAPSKNDGRVENLNDNNASNNRVTNGCINGKCEDLTELYNTPGVGKGTMIYVLPEDAGNNFVFENGEINYYTSRENQTDALKYIDERGEEQDGHGIANKTTTNYKPINITFDKNYYQTNSKRYDGTAAGEEEEFVNNTQPFLNSIVDNKKLLMDKLGMDGDMYNDLSMIAFGIYGYESGMGDEGSAGENLLKAGLKYTGIQDTSPDVKSKYDTYGVDGDGNSVGWTQIRWNQLDDTEKAALKKIDITSNDQLMDPANAAKATTAILYKRYQNQISRADKNSEDFDIFTALPKKWNKGEGYTDVVNTYMDYIDLTETDVDDVDNKLIVKGEYKDDNIESNERMSNKPIEEKILNMGETIAHEYNQSDYIKPSVDAVVEGVEGVGDWIGETADDVSEWWDEVDLNPFYKSGGEFGIDNQVQFYNDYINGLYKNTKQEKKSKKMYDKLNRLYYNDSKQNNMHQLDVMESIKRQG
tara:strand:+ start:2680 stop:10284 length:7605 start_codon:yes stop_codon:yes gene_type:complete